MTEHRVQVDAKRLTADRRAGIIPARRSAWALVLVVAVMGCCGGVAWAENSSQQVTAMIYRAGQQTPTTDSTSIGTLIQSGCPLYTPPPSFDYFKADGSPAGVPEQVNAGAVWSLKDVLGCMPTPILPGDFKSITVLGANGVPELSQNSQLSPADLASPSDFANTSEVPFVDSDGTNTYYFRPWRGQGQGDSNLQDEVQGSGLTLEVFEGPGMTVTASASPSATIPAGTTVTFTASDPASDPGVAYKWYLQGQQFSSGSNVRLPFSSAGVFDVYVQATDAAGGSGQAKVPITVTAATTPKTPTSGNPNPNGSPTSPGGAGGTTSGKNPKHGSATGTGNHGKTSTASHHGGGTTSATHANTTPSTPPASHGAATRVARHHTAKRASAPVRKRPKSVANGSTHTQLVSGRLISNVTPVASNVSPLVHLTPASVGTAPALRRPAPASIVPPVGAGLLVVLLLLLGAGRELRWRGVAMPRFGS